MCTWMSVTRWPAIMPRLLRVPTVEAAAAFLAQASVGHQAPQQLRRPEGLGPKLAMKVLRDREPHVEADEIGQPQRPHRVPVPERHRLVDILRRSDPLLEHADRLEPEQHAEPAGGEPRTVANDDR